MSNRNPKKIWPPGPVHRRKKTANTWLTDLALCGASLSGNGSTEWSPVTCLDCLALKGVHGPRKTIEKTCTVCLSVFNVPRTADGKLSRRNTCSPECERKLDSGNGGGNKRARYPCEVCGAIVKERRSRACSLSCGAVLANRTRMSNITSEPCKYSAPSDRDLRYMLDIMHRKGYTQGKDEKEAYKYRIEKGTRNILYHDLPPHPSSDDGKACIAEEQQKHRYRVEQEAEKEGAYLTGFKELPHSKEDWLTSIEKSLGFRTTNWGLQ